MTLIQDAPIDTLDYIILGFGVVLGVILLYLGSLGVRFRKLRREWDLLEVINAE